MKKRDLRFFTILLCVGMLVGALGGCSQNQPQPEVITLTREKDEKALEDFEGQYLSEYLESAITYTTWSNAEEIPPEKLLRYYECGEFFRVIQDMDLTQFEPVEGGDRWVTLPAEQVEGYIQSHFDVSKEHLRKAENYDPAIQCYGFDSLGGFGGGYPYIAKLEQHGTNYIATIFRVDGPGNVGTIYLDANGSSYRFTGGKSIEPVTATVTRESDEAAVNAFEQEYLQSYFTAGIDSISWDDASEIPIEKLLLYYECGEFQRVIEGMDLTGFEPYKGGWWVTLPAEQVESYLESHFHVEQERLREAENYNATSQRYGFSSEGGFGGLYSSLDKIEQNGNEYTLTFSRGDPEGGIPMITGVVTMEIGENWYYTGGEVLS